MSSQWECCEVPIKFQISDRTLFAPVLRLQTRAAAFYEDPATAELVPPRESLQAGAEGFLIRSLPITAAQPSLRRERDYFCYVPSQYRRYFIDLRQSFDDYKRQFSSKTRSTLQRKVRKYAEHSGGEVLWKVYTAPSDVPEFFRLAREVSAKTYQERLLDAGLPESPEFLEAAQALAAEDRLRAFILFDRERPVSYLFCPVERGVLTYQYLGYDPEYMKLSVGTVLQWLALEHLFAENRFRLFDFTEGESEHKKLFSTGSVHCANVFFLRANLRNSILLRGQLAIDALSGSIGTGLDRLGLKARIRKLLRFG
jgi:CelD/BcsL family acetyltransferase involved in cellulose biosynthesis